MYYSTSVVDHYGGYIAFVKLVGYHRGLWIYITQSVLIEFHQHESIPPLAINIRVYDPRTVRSFNTFLHHIFLKYNVYSCIAAIHKLTVYPLPAHHSRSFKRLDNLVVKLIQKSDLKDQK